MFHESRRFARERDVDQRIEPVIAYAVAGALTMALALASRPAHAAAGGAADSTAKGAVAAAGAGAFPNLTGTWILDRKHSDDLSKLRPSGGGPGGRGEGGGGHGAGGGWSHGGGGMGGHGGGGFGGGGFRGGRREGGGGPPGGGAEGGPDRRGMRNPQPEKLTLDQHDDVVQFYDGAAVEQTFAWGAMRDTAGIVHAAWQGRRLVADLPSPRGGSRRESLELDPTGRILTVVLDVERPGSDPVVLRSKYTKYEGE